MCFIHTDNSFLWGNDVAIEMYMFGGASVPPDSTTAYLAQDNDEFRLHPVENSDVLRYFICMGNPG